MISDIVMIGWFSSKEKVGHIVATFICFLVSLCLQSVIVLIGYKKQSCTKQLKEQVFLWLIVKPDVDAYRVANHSELCGEGKTH